MGRTAIWRNDLMDCYYQKAIHRLKPLNSEVAPELMLRFMKYAKNTGVFTNYTSQTSIAHLTQEKLSEVRMFVPPPNEQQRMIQRFDLTDYKINAEVEYLAKLNSQKSGLMHDLLTGIVPVTVDETETTHTD